MKFYGSDFGGGISDPEWGWSGLFFTTEVVRVDFLERRYEREQDLPGGGPWKGGLL